jgi:hypothetical protein
MSNNDREYYLARISAERAAAAQATNEEARRVHLKLADEYEQMLAAAPRPSNQA